MTLPKTSAGGLAVPYRNLDEYMAVDIEQLRPGGSYGNLIKKRTYTIDALVERHGSIPQELLKERNCPGCGSARKAPCMHKDHMDIVSCLECRLIYVSPIFDDEHYRAAYDSGEYRDIVKALGVESHVYRVERFGAERVAIISKFLEADRGPVRHLDIGCSTGFMTEAAKKAGWDSIGIDLNQSAVEFGAARGLKLRFGDLFDFKFDTGSFDVVTLFDVLEHLVSPRKVVEEAARILRPGGLLFIFVPNWDSASRVLMGEQAHFIWPTHHLTYFTPTTLSNFITGLGLNIELLVTEGLDIFDYLWAQEESGTHDTAALRRIANELQFFINAGAWGKNLRCLARRT